MIFHKKVILPDCVNRVITRSEDSKVKTNEVFLMYTVSAVFITKPHITVITKIVPDPRDVITDCQENHLVSLIIVSSSVDIKGCVKESVIHEGSPGAPGIMVLVISPSAMDT